MSDELQEQEGQATETETTEQATGSNQNKQQATFTQEDVNKIVAKERAAWKRAQDKASADNETIVGSLRSDVEKRDEVIKKQLALLEQDLGLDEDTQVLLDGLDTLARYDWVLNKVEKAGKHEIPRTPRGEGEIKSAPFKRIHTI